MIDFIAEIYTYAQLIPCIKELIETCRKGDVALIGQQWNDISDLIGEFCEKVSGKNTALANEIWSCFEKACGHTTDGTGSYNLMADDLERALGKMYEAMKMWGRIDATEGDIRLLSSDSGFLTMQNTVLSKYLHSTLDPMDEARTIARGIYGPRQQNCRIMGCGLGYLPWQLFCASGESLDVYVYETDDKRIKYAFDYGVLSWIPEDKLHIVTDSDQLRLFEAYGEDAEAGVAGKTAYYISEDMLDRLGGEVKEKLAAFNISCRSHYFLRNSVESNFYRNIGNVKKNIYDIDKAGLKEDWIIVAAGPSLDNKLDYIRMNQGKKTIVAVSTVYKKLTDAGIKADFVTSADPQNRTYGHFDGLADHSAALILNSTGNWQFGEYYKGDKYLVFGQGEEAVSEYCNNRGIKMIATGSTIPTLSIAVAAELGAKNIDLLGLDLAFPGGHSHASGTMDLEEIDTNDLPLIDSVDGGKVASKQEFIFYKNELEKMIAGYPGIRFVNYSDKGAHIQGTLWYKDIKEEEG